MTLTCSAHEIEFRDPLGQDHILQVDVWRDVGGLRAVLVLRNLRHSELDFLDHAHAALHALHHDWLPYLLRPGASVMVLALRPAQSNRKARALVLPLSA
ncbi:hypothetical protein [Deinococcus fonticola]|uniref:hypothetical protein n=1 Tax=Deinococcus fonticola TaxID=2528713 RepID=UPI0010755C3A|nr:hypothetical protein [Deinococcus fonticola]